MNSVQEFDNSSYNRKIKFNPCLRKMYLFKQIFRMQL